MTGRVSDTFPAAGLLSARPADPGCIPGFYSATDTGIIYRWDGDSWETWATLGGSGGGGWELAIDNPGTSMTGITAHNGTWAINGTSGYLRQSATTADHLRASLTAAFPVAHAIWEAEVRILSGSGAATQVAGLVYGTTSVGVNGGIGFRLEANASGPTAIVLERDGLANIWSVSQDWGSFDEWHTLRLVVAGATASAYLDGAFVGAGRIAIPEGERSRIGFKAYACAAEFRNFKAWRPAMP